MGEPIQNVLVVGGGTSGWMTAAYLIKAFGPNVRITLMEAPSIPKIGVGEATVPNLQKSFFDFLEIPEEIWMKAVNGAFKTAVKFINWRKRADGAPNDHFYHPFGILPYVDGMHLPAYWFHSTRGKQPFDYSCFREPAVMDALCAPKFLDGKRAVPHAWHFDAHLVADFLCRWATEKGVERILDEVEQVVLTERGHIGSVKTKGGRTVTADLFVDCTGFRGLLINVALKEPFIDMKDHLLCDSAVAAAIPNDDEKVGIEPYTSAIAMKAGWTWKIPMLTRFGSGYVYSSKFATEDDAVRDYCALWGIKESSVQFNRIRFRTGRNRRAWVNNCVSIGLSSCFLEPLESTGIYFITAAIYQLAKHFPTKDMEPGLITQFNREIEYMFDDSRDFLQAHYLTSSREDSAFWLANKHELYLSDNIKEKIATYKAGMPINAPLSTEEDYYGSLENEFRSFWTNGSYYCIFAGMGFYPDQPAGRLAYRPKGVDEANALMHRIQQKGRELAANLPSNFEYLRQFHAGTMAVEKSPALKLSWGQS